MDVDLRNLDLIKQFFCWFVGYEVILTDSTPLWLFSILVFSIQ